MQTYGLDGDYPSHLQPELLDVYYAASEDWHRLVGVYTEKESAPRRGPGDNAQLQKPPSSILQAVTTKKSTINRRCGRPLVIAVPGGREPLYKSPLAISIFNAAKKSAINRRSGEPPV